MDLRSEAGCSRQHTVSLLDALAIEGRRRRWVDAARKARKTAQQQGFKAAAEAIAARGGRSLDVEAQNRRQPGQQEELISRNFAEPSDGLEPSTPSLPSSNEAGTTGKAGKSRARKTSKNEDSSEGA
jgi:hypothetical protein